VLGADSRLVPLRRPVVSSLHPSSRSPIRINKKTRIKKNGEGGVGGGWWGEGKKKEVEANRTASTRLTTTNPFLDRMCYISSIKLYIYSTYSGAQARLQWTTR
jgi:hypothetical protein